jgi:hypothetical protein
MKTMNLPLALLHPELWHLQGWLCIVGGEMWGRGCCTLVSNLILIPRDSKCRPCPSLKKPENKWHQWIPDPNLWWFSRFWKWRVGVFTQQMLQSSTQFPSLWTEGFYDREVPEEVLVKIVNQSTVEICRDCREQWHPTVIKVDGNDQKMQCGFPVLPQGFVDSPVLYHSWA